jgi:hypothetical protein
MLQHPPLSLTVMTKNLSPDNLAILGTHYIKEFLMKRRKRENLVGKKTPSKEEKKCRVAKSDLLSCLHHSKHSSQFLKFLFSEGLGEDVCNLRV